MPARALAPAALATTARTAAGASGGWRGAPVRARDVMRAYACCVCEEEAHTCGVFPTARRAGPPSSHRSSGTRAGCPAPHAGLGHSSADLGHSSALSLCPSTQAHLWRPSALLPAFPSTEGPCPSRTLFSSHRVFTHCIGRLFVAWRMLPSPNIHSLSRFLLSLSVPCPTPVLEVRRHPELRFCNSVNQPYGLTRRN